MEKLSIFSNPSKDNSDKTYAFGIDLGTTNSCISYTDNFGVAEIITLKDGNRTMPSCVMYKDNKFTVGREAYENRYNPNVVYSVKRLMGENTTVTFIDGEDKKEMTPVEVSAEILKGLVDLVPEMYGKVVDVVITVPAGFTTSQVEDTRKAAELAGLNILSIMREPTAAALAYGLDSSDKNEKILVYDLGGGTFDVSLVDIATTGSNTDSDLFDMLGVSDSSDSKSNVLNVVTTRGNNKLGGDDLDKEILKVLKNKVKSEGKTKRLIAGENEERLLLNIEKYKKMEQFSNIDMFLWEHETTGEDYHVSLLQNDIKIATSKIFNKTKRYIDDILNSSVDLDAIVLVGGSTKNRFLQQLIEETYDLPVYKHLNPDESVALGAAILAKRLKFGDESVSVFDITSNAIGILADGRVVRLIDKDQPLPVKKYRKFSTTVANQKQIRVQVYEGNSVYPEKCTYLGDLLLKDIPEGGAGEVSVGIALTVDLNGQLNCMAETTNGSKSINLVNILGKTENTDGLNKDVLMAVTRWRKFADKLEGATKESFLAEIDRVEEENSLDNIQPILDVIKVERSK